MYFVGVNYTTLSGLEGKELKECSYKQGGRRVKGLEKRNLPPCVVNKPFVRKFNGIESYRNFLLEAEKILGNMTLSVHRIV